MDKQNKNNSIELLPATIENPDAKIVVDYTNTWYSKNEQNYLSMQKKLNLQLEEVDSIKNTSDRLTKISSFKDDILKEYPTLIDVENITKVKNSISKISSVLVKFTKFSDDVKLKFKEKWVTTAKDLVTETKEKNLEDKENVLNYFKDKGIYQEEEVLSKLWLECLESYEHEELDYRVVTASTFLTKLEDLGLELYFQKYLDEGQRYLLAVAEKQRIKDLEVASQQIAKMNEEKARADAENAVLKARLQALEEEAQKVQASTEPVKVEETYFEVPTTKNRVLTSSFEPTMNEYTIKYLKDLLQVNSLYLRTPMSSVGKEMLEYLNIQLPAFIKQLENGVNNNE